MISHIGRSLKFVKVILQRDDVSIDLHTVCKKQSLCVFIDFTILHYHSVMWDWRKCSILSHSKLGLSDSFIPRNVSYTTDFVVCCDFSLRYFSDKIIAFSDNIAFCLTHRVF